MIIGALKETKYQETRVAITPNTVSKYKTLGFDVLIESSLGKLSGFTDEAYLKNGAKIAKSRSEILKQAHILVNIWPIAEYEYKKLKNGQILIANFEHAQNCATLTDKKVTIIALEKVPRISRAQNIDILSSQSNLAGYKAALVAMNMLNRAVPMMITAAGTVKPVKVLIVGLGVAGAAALATFKRMGAIVYASDIRKEAKEETISLGGRFVEPAQQIETLKNTDILITSVILEGKPAPLLFTKKDLEQMPPNSVIVDLACTNVETKGLRKDIKVIKNSFFASEVPYSASNFFSKNVFNLIKENGGTNFKINPEDEIFKAICLCNPIISGDR